MARKNLPSHPRPPLYFGMIGTQQVSSIDWSKITGTPTTRDGYGITDVYTEAEADAAFAALAHTHAWADITGEPTTLAGYGITDAYTDTEVDALFAALALGDLSDWPADASGVLTNDGAGNLTWSAAGAGTVDGTGTGGFVPVWSDSDTLDDSVLEDISSAGNSIMRISSAAGVAQLYLDAVAEQVRDIVFSTATSPRWIFRCDLVAESGSNAGSNFNITRRADDGSDLGPAFAILRSSGQVTAYQHVVPNTSAAQDLGTSSNLWRDLFVGTVKASTAVNINSVKILGTQGAAVANVAAGGTTDTNCRTTVNSILARLRAHGIIAT